MVNDVPIIPVIEAVDWYQYDTGTFSGWPTPGNPYAQPVAVRLPGQRAGAAAPGAEVTQTPPGRALRQEPCPADPPSPGPRKPDQP